MTARVLYEKRGRRYQPVAEYDDLLMNAMPKGSHLVCVEPGRRSYRYDVETHACPLLAALHLHRDKLVKLVRQSSTITRSSTRTPTPKEKKPTQLTVR